MIGLMADYMQGKGGIEYFQRKNEFIISKLYNLIDGSDGFYSNKVGDNLRSNSSI
jgi:phosphoserine aminotransferase